MRDGEFAVRDLVARRFRLRVERVEIAAPARPGDVAQFGVIEIDVVETVARNQRLDIGERGDHAARFDDRRFRFVGHREIVEHDRAVETQLRRFVLDEMRAHAAGNEALRNCHRQLGSHVGEVLRQVEAIEGEVDRRFETVLERFGLALDAQRPAVDACREQGLHEHVDVTRQVGEKRDADLDVLDAMACVRRLVVEADLAAVDADVRQRETRGLRRRSILFCRRAGKTLDQIGEIEAPICHAR